jgi:hypothetical protein
VRSRLKISIQSRVGVGKRIANHLRQYSSGFNGRLNLYSFACPCQVTSIPRGHNCRSSRDCPPDPDSNRTARRGLGLLGA